VHGLIFFYIQKFADRLAANAAVDSTVRASLVSGTARYLPSGVYPDADAVVLLEAIAEGLGEPLPDTLVRFGEFLAPNLLRVAGQLVRPEWRSLDVIEHTEELIHAMIRSSQPGAEPPVLEAVRGNPDELHLVYTSRRRLCLLATGLVRGLARHFGDTLVIEEPSCMLRGDPFCSFVVRKTGRDTHAANSPVSETIVLPPGSGSAAGGPLETDPGLAVVPDVGAEDVQPQQIGGHRIVRLIGTGAMGRVYLAQDERLDRSVAIKVLSRHRARDAAARQRFLREGRAAAAVEHPHVLAIHAVGEQDGRPFIVMQHLEGTTLAAHLAADGSPPLAESLRIGREIAEGLAAAHARGLVHRDVKPDNVFLVGPSRSVRIIDFGLARDVDAAPNATRVTTDGAIVGTPAYMPPERIGGESLDVRSDLFGLGVILYELIAGRLPFDGTTMVTMLAAIARGDPTPLAEAAPATPTEVAALVMRLLAHRREDRPASAAEVAASLATLERTVAPGR